VHVFEKRYPLSRPAATIRPTSTLADFQGAACELGIDRVVFPSHRSSIDKRHSRRQGGVNAGSELVRAPRAIGWDTTDDDLAALTLRGARVRLNTTTKAACRSR